MGRAKHATGPHWAHDRRQRCSRPRGRSRPRDVVRVKRGTVDTGGVEPPPSRLSVVRSNHLSYVSMVTGWYDIAPRGIEPRLSRARTWGVANYTKEQLGASDSNRHSLGPMPSVLPIGRTPIRPGGGAAQRRPPGVLLNFSWSIGCQTSRASRHPACRGSRPAAPWRSGGPVSCAHCTRSVLPVLCVLLVVVTPAGLEHRPGDSLATCILSCNFNLHGAALNAARPSSGSSREGLDSIVA